MLNTKLAILLHCEWEEQKHHNVVVDTGLEIPTKTQTDLEMQNPESKHTCLLLWSWHWVGVELSNARTEPGQETKMQSVPVSQLTAINFLYSLSKLASLWRVSILFIKVVKYIQFLFFLSCWLKQHC